MRKKARTNTAIQKVIEYVRANVPEPEVLRKIGEESKRNGTDRLTSRDIDAIIKEARRSERIRSTQ